MARPTAHHVAPEKTKTAKDPILLEKLSSLVCAVAFSTPNPASMTKASPAKARPFEQAGVATVRLDLDDEAGMEAALQGIDSAFLLTGYTVDMLRQSKVFLDKAARAGVGHIVHLGACGDDEGPPRLL